MGHPATTVPAITGTVTTSDAALLTELQLKADLTETQPISAASLPLPTGAATAANQLPAGHNVTVIAPLPALVASAANIGDVDVLTLPALVAGTANIGDVDVLTLPTSGGKTITWVSVNQGAAGTTTLAAASVGNFHKLVGAILVLSVLGTLKFTDGTADLSGPMDIAANAGFVLPTSMMPYTQTAATNRPLNLVTTLGAARGMVAILTEA